MSIFKACDIRGEYGSELSEALARRLGQAVGTRLAGQTLVVGGDVRLSTPSLKAALIDGLVATGCHVLDLGTVPTPVLSFARPRLGAQGSIMVTASHNPATHNGFKLMLGDRPPGEETLQAIEAEMAAGAFAEGQGSAHAVDILPEYEENLVRRFAPGGALSLVVDCGNGCYSHVAPRVLRRLGYRVEGLFCQPDGRFPNRPPNPALARNLRALCERVVEGRADLGVAFDGDGDRVAFVDDTGTPAESDRVAVLFARWALRQGPGEVIYDIKSSSVLKEAVEEAGGRATMERSGHAFIKTALLERDALFGAEISGHYFFRELGGDDGLFACCLLLQILQAEERGLAGLLQGVPRHPITPDIRLPCPPERAGAILEELRRAFPGYPVSLLDGTRVDFGDGWALARRSVTEALITLRFEAHSQARLTEIQALVRRRVPALAAIWSA
ncbi:MAG: phosphomannomutase/phosphoglucomutase [Anaerolineae bacterium]|nr:phosphomannomutase/phosphoglucomutase [Anaerolineae bacterium]